MLDSRFRHVFFGWALVAWVGLSVVCDGATSIAATVEVVVVTSDGESLSGGLAEMSDQAIALDVGSEVRTIPLDNTSRIDFPHSSLPALPTVVELRGGSKVHVSGVTWDGDELKLTPSRQSSLQLPIARLRSIRFRTGNPATDATWLGWSEDARRGDRLAVRRDEKTLDSIDGTVVGIGPQTVQFEMAGNTIAAPIAKLEGILFSSTNPNSQISADPIRVLDTSGSQYVAVAVRLAPDSDHLDIQLPGQIGHSIPLDQVMSIGFAGGVLRLVEAEVASSRFLAGPKSEAFPSWMQDWFEPQTGDPGSDDTDAILMRSPSEIRFRIPEGYQKLKAAVRRHPEVNWFLPVRVEVLADEEVVWSATLENRESLGLELELGDARTLTLRTSANDSEKKSTTSANPTIDRSNSFLPRQLGGQIQWFGGRLLK